jgi:hypothetical protein
MSLESSWVPNESSTHHDWQLLVPAEPYDPKVSRPATGLSLTSMLADRPGDITPRNRPRWRR